jgi:methyl-accepting chemotaxis protein
MGVMINWEIITERVLAKEREKQIQAEQAEKNNLEKKVNELLLTVEAATKGNLTQQVTISGSDDMGRLGTSLSTMFNDLRNVIAEVIETANQFASSSELIATSSNNLHHSAQTQSDSINQMTSSISKMSSSIQSISETVTKVNHLASDTALCAKQGGDAVSKSVEAMALIKSSSEQISEIINVIREIANQTNLLRRCRRRGKKIGRTLEPSNKADYWIDHRVDFARCRRSDAIQESW